MSDTGWSYATALQALESGLIMGCWQPREVGRGRYRTRGALFGRVSRRDIASGCLRWQLAKTVAWRVDNGCMSGCLYVWRTVRRLV
jgi:hypothetical protein